MNKLSLGFTLITSFSLLHAQQSVNKAPTIHTDSGMVQGAAGEMLPVSKGLHMPNRLSAKIAGDHRSLYTHAGGPGSNQIRSGLRTNELSAWQGFNLQNIPEVKPDGLAVGEPDPGKLDVREKAAGMLLK